MPAVAPEVARHVADDECAELLGRKMILPGREDKGGQARRVL